MGTPPRDPAPGGPRPPARPPSAGGGGLRGLLGRLRRLIGGGPKPPAPPAAAPQGRKITAEPGWELPASWQLPARPSARVSYRRDRLAAGMRSSTTARERAVQRQVLLAVIAVVMLAVAGAVAAVRLAGGGTLPMSVRGVWQTEGPRYQQRLFELSGKRLAFQTSDTTAAIHQIRRVRRTAGEETTTFDVEYEDGGTTYTFSFSYYAGPPEELRFVNQPFMVWTRSSDRRRLLPELF